MPRIGIDVDSIAAQRRINRLAKALGRDTALELIAQRHLNWINKNLKAAGLEEPWEQMAPSTRFVRPQRPASNNFSSQFLTQLSQSMTILRKSGSAVTVGTEQKYADYQHFGTKPYVIRPKRAKFLRFVGNSGAMVIARKVNHPGIPARPMLPSKMMAKNLAIQVLQAAKDKGVS